MKALVMEIIYIDVTRGAISMGHVAKDYTSVMPMLMLF